MRIQIYGDNVLFFHVLTIHVSNRLFFLDFYLRCFLFLDINETNFWHWDSIHATLGPFTTITTGQTIWVFFIIVSFDDIILCQWSWKSPEDRGRTSQLVSWSENLRSKYLLVVEFMALSITYTILVSLKTRRAVAKLSFNKMNDNLATARPILG